MDFWSRLIGNAGKHKHSSSQASTPQQRLQRFRRAYNPILQLCSRPQVTAASGPALDQLRVSLQRIVIILREEGRTPAPHLCLSFAASAQVYSVIARAAATSHNEAVVREAISIFSMLVDSEEEHFLSSTVFSKSLIRFVTRVTASSSIGDDAETELIEVLFGVAAKLRVQPDILPVWFHASVRPPVQETARGEKKSFAGTTQKDDFPLCYLLIDRVHHEGRIGDFARTGLLYIFEAVSHSTDLENWLVSSDIPTLMASGLGALYSQLSRELSIRHDIDRMPLMLALSDYAEMPARADAENIFSTSHINHLSTFLSHLAFWQDVLEHCKSALVKQTLLDHFQILFLQQLLYPSLLQSSDTDGGSSVAVLTYLANTLEALDHPDLVRMILQYLLAIQAPKPSTHPSTDAAARRQSSLQLLDNIASDEEKVDPNLFSLVDLILNGIRSRNPQTTVSALKLSSVLLNRHTDYALTTLVKTEPVSVTTERRTAGALAHESEALMNIAVILGYKESLDDAYTTALQDVISPLEVQAVRRSQEKNNAQTEPQHTPIPMRILINDPFLSAISDLFSSFFTNNVDVNLSLTEAVVQLALRSQISLDGWLAAAPSSYRFNEEDSGSQVFDERFLDEEEALALRKLQQAHRRPLRIESQAPVLPALLERLQASIDRMRDSITNLDTLITKRIEILSGVEKDEHPLPIESRAPSRMSSDAGNDNARLQRLSESKQIQRLKSASIASSRVSSPTKSPTPSRSHDITRAKSPSRGGESPARPPLKPDSGRLSHGVFLPPPPDSIDEGGQPPISGPLTNSYAHEAEILQRRLMFHRRTSDYGGVFQYATDFAKTYTKNTGFEAREASASHVLTNIVILHFFVLELVAVLQTRAIMFDEVTFS
ncbi:hypothetical protein AAFC00_004027 [Neodothiora populina]|uniref:Retinoic acid induced 16-like protein-domain-containing protein n=1 Tax=Neodothiora populina TaxID=2781224 RepID=A0ABR3PIA5_9PEZI